jgi:hypothetical protein
LTTIGRPMSPRMPVRCNQRSRDDRSNDHHGCGEPSPVFLDSREAAELIRVSVITLSRWRIQGQGPLFRKFGRRVVYAHADLMNWANDQRRESTSAASRSRAGDRTE